MQTPKAKPGSLEVSQRKASTTTTTPRTARQLKTPGSDTDMTRTPKSSPKVVDRRSPRSPASEKKRMNRPVSEPEPELSKLREELKKVKEQLSAAESGKRQAVVDAEEAKNELSAMVARLEESERQLSEFSNCEDDRIHELRKLSQERDKAWESELEAVQKQHSMDSAALASAINEVQKLKAQLERVSESEREEVRDLRVELSEKLSLVQNLRDELDDRKASSAETCEDLSSELDQSRARVKSLEGLVKKLQAELINGNGQKINDGGESEELGSAKSEIARLRSALDAGEVRYQEEFIRSTLQIRSAYEQAERARAESAQKETELKKSELYIAELKALLMESETRPESFSPDSMTEENVSLRTRIASLETETMKAVEEAATSTELARSAEREALMKLGYATDEADKNGRRVARITEQLETAVAERSEMEAELRRLKVQADQWRKAAEAAASMISGENDGNNNGRIDSMYNLMGSPFSEDMDDDSPKKKNGNMLKKIGVLWKKGQK